MMSGNQSYILYSQNAELHHAGWYVIHSLVFFVLPMTITLEYIV